MVQSNKVDSLKKAWWSNPAGWPRGDSANVFLAKALDQVGRAVAPDWTGNEPLEAIQNDLRSLATFSVRRDLRADWKRETQTIPLSISSPPASFRLGAERNDRARQVAATPDWHVRQYRENRRQALAKAQFEKATSSFSRLQAAMDWIQAQACEPDGRLIARGRRVAGGEYHTLPHWIWNVEGLWDARFRECQVSFIGGLSYIFLDRECLTRCLSQVPKPKAKPDRHPSSLVEEDEPLVADMRQLIQEGKASGPYAAALAVVDRAAGGGSDESRTRRLEKRYLAKFGK